MILYIEYLIAFGSQPHRPIVQVLDVSASATGPVCDIRSLGVLIRHTLRRHSNDAVSTRDGQAFCRAADLPRILSSLNVLLANEDIDHLTWSCLEIHAREKARAQGIETEGGGIDWVPAYSSAARRTDRMASNPKGPPSADVPLVYAKDLVTYFWGLRV